MSLWYCPSCKGLVGGSNATCTCPVCGTGLEYATIGSPVLEQKVVQNAEPQPQPDPFTGLTQAAQGWTFCWCTNLHAVGLPVDQKCEPCTRREHAEFKEALKTIMVLVVPAIADAAIVGESYNTLNIVESVAKLVGEYEDLKFRMDGLEK